MTTVIINKNIYDNFTLLSYRTQGSTKVFKCQTNKVCIFRLNCVLNDESFLVHIPDNIVCYEDSRYKQFLNINVSDKSSLLFVDWYSSGRLVIIINIIITIFITLLFSLFSLSLLLLIICYDIYCCYLLLLRLYS